MSATPVILSLNSGSSSLKFALYQLGGEAEILIAAGAVEQVGLSSGYLSIRGQDKSILTEAHEDFSDHQAAVRAAFTALEQLSLPPPTAVGHRLVHGGASHIAPERVTPQLMTSLRRLI